MNRNWIKIASIYIGTVIGAGFASGREILDFFAIYGAKGIWGIYIAGLLFATVGSLLLYKIHKGQVKNFDQLNQDVFGKKLAPLVDALTILSLYTGFSVMVAGSGAVFKEQLGLPFYMGVVVMLVCCFIVFLFNLEGLSLINTILVPLLIIGILFTSHYFSSKTGYKFPYLDGISFTLKGNFISSAILYFGSNSLLIIVVFSSLGDLIDSRRTAILGGLTGGFILYILGMAILYSILLHFIEIQYVDVPMLKISNYISKDYGKIYSLILWIAMFTTALANGFGFVNRLGRSRNRIIVIVIFSISTIPLARLGFAKLIGIIYPVFGLIGSIMIFRIIISNK